MFFRTFAHTAAGNNVFCVMWLNWVIGGVVGVGCESEEGEESLGMGTFSTTLETTNWPHLDWKFWLGLPAYKSERGFKKSWKNIWHRMLIEARWKLEAMDLISGKVIHKDD